MSDIIINSKYAPGISTYGIKGMRGETGQAGYSLYFSPYTDITNDNLIHSIKNNIFISDNNLLSNDLRSMKNRKYQSNDLILSADGKIYRLNNVETGEIDSTPLIDLYGSLNGIIVNNDSNIISNHNGKKLYIGNRTDASVNISAMLTIESNNDNYITLSTNGSNNMSIKNVSVNDKQCILFDTSNNVYINNLYVENNTTDDKITLNNKLYYKVVTQNQIGNVNDSSIYTLTADGSIILNCECEYKYIENDANNNILISCYYDGISNEHQPHKTINEYKTFEIYIHYTNYITKYIDVIKSNNI